MKDIIFFANIKEINKPQLSMKVDLINNINNNKWKKLSHNNLQWVPLDDIKLCAQNQNVQGSYFLWLN